MQQIVKSGAATSFAETPPVIPVNYQNFNRPYPPPKVFAHFTDSELSCSS
jgi:hypothetical protein